MTHYIISHPYSHYFQILSGYLNKIPHYIDLQDL